MILFVFITLDNGGRDDWANYDRSKIHQKVTAGKKIYKHFLRKYFNLIFIIMFLVRCFWSVYIEKALTE
jgi:hypothetical protein